jgi:hypothetical protein
MCGTVLMKVRVVHHAAVDLVRPELARDLERFVDLYRLLDTNGTVLFCGV